VKQIPVVDADGRILGFLEQADVARAFTSPPSESTPQN
jgi:CBS-domain-containing membrane protein